MQNQVKIVAALALLVVGFGFLYSDVVVKLVNQWATDDNYSHGFLIVPIALYFVWERRVRLAEAARQPTILGIVVLLGSLVLLAFGTLGAELFMTRIALLATLVGLLLFTCGWQHLKILAFPLAFLLLMIPIPAIVFNQIAIACDRDPIEVAIDEAIADCRRVSLQLDTIVARTEQIKHFAPFDGYAVVGSL